MRSIALTMTTRNASREASDSARLSASVRHLHVVPVDEVDPERKRSFQEELAAANEAPETPARRSTKP